MIRKSISKRAEISIGIISIISLVLLYSFLSIRQHIRNPKDTSIPNARQFLAGAKTILGFEIVEKNSEGVEYVRQDAMRWWECWLWVDFTTTYYQLFLGLFLGVCLSFVIGVLMGCYGYTEAFFKFPLSFFAFIPPTAMIAVWFVVFGMDTQFFVAVVALGIFPVLTQTICESVQKDVKINSIYKAYTLGASTTEVIFDVVIPKILPRFLEAVRLMIGPAMIFIIAAGFFIGDVGLGYRLRVHSKLTNMNIVYLYLIIIGITGYFIDFIFRYFRHWLCPWFEDG